VKKLSVFGLGLTFAGSILGPAFVSGQELWLYFGSYGLKGIAGLITAIAILVLFNIMVMRITELSGDETMDRILFSPGVSSRLREGCGLLFVFFYFCVTVVMLAGMASLANRMFNLPLWAGGLIATFLTLAIAYFGLTGMTSVFNVCIPVLVAAAILFSVLRISTVGAGQIVLVENPSNPLLGNFLFSSVNYAAYNLFAGIGIMGPLVALMKNKKHIPAGIILGGVLLLLIAVSVILALATSPESIAEDLPMLSLAIQMGTVFGIIYAILLFMGMFGSTVATLVAINTYLQAKFTVFKKHTLPFLIALGVLAFLLSLFGFTELVGVIYPVMGYVGAASMVLLYIRWVRLENENKKNNLKK